MGGDAGYWENKVCFVCLEGLNWEKDQCGCGQGRAERNFGGFVVVGCWGDGYFWRCGFRWTS